MLKFEKKAKKTPPKGPKSHKGYSKKYPQFAFRIPQSESAQATLDAIKRDLKALHENYKKKCTPGHKLLNRNDLILEALKLGVAILKKEAKS